MGGWPVPALSPFGPVGAKPLVLRVASSRAKSDMWDSAASLHPTASAAAARICSILRRDAPRRASGGPYPAAFTDAVRMCPTALCL
jgi:hypothetical protein